jgi:hypothetical protein
MAVLCGSAAGEDALHAIVQELDLRDDKQKSQLRRAQKGAIRLSQHSRHLVYLLIWSKIFCFAHSEVLCGVSTTPDSNSDVFDS